MIAATSVTTTTDPVLQGIATLASRTSADRVIADVWRPRRTRPSRDPAHCRSGTLHKSRCCPLAPADVAPPSGARQQCTGPDRADQPSGDHVTGVVHTQIHPGEADSTDDEDRARPYRDVAIPGVDQPARGCPCRDQRSGRDAKGVPRRKRITIDRNHRLRQGWALASHLELHHGCGQSESC